MSTKKIPQVPQMRGVEDFLSMQNVGSSSTQVPIDKIHFNPKQPRRYFDPVKLARLAESIKEHGIIEALIVRPLENGEYELVAGERRLRAATMAGLVTVKTEICELDDKKALQIALIENLDREDLNPIEETEGILQLVSLQLEVTNTEVISILNQVANAKKRNLELTENVSRQLEIIESTLSSVGKFTAESFRTSRLPLLNLPADVLHVIREGKIEYTKARAIARVKDEEQRGKLLDRAVQENLSLSQIQQLIKELQSPPTPPITPKEVVNTQYSEIGKKLKTTQVWEDKKKLNRLQKLLNDLEQLLDE